jgi:nitroreductase
MADNYLEKREQELREARPKVVRAHPSLESLLKRNRSYRGFAPSRVVSREELVKLLEVTRWIGSGMNAQPLRYRLVSGADAARVHPLVHLGAALPEHVPHPGEEPSAYIIVCSEASGRVVDIDLGIAAQSILLRAVEMGLGGIFILNFNPDALQEALSLPLPPLAVIAIGKPIERVFLVDAHPGDSLSYYRRDGVHFVPKLSVEDIII